MQVLSDGRVRRNREEWEQLLKRYTQSGLTEAAFCERENLSRSSLTHWKHRLRETGTDAPAFVELTPFEKSASPAGEFELSLPGGVLLRWKA